MSGIPLIKKTQNTKRSCISFTYSLGDLVDVNRHTLSLTLNPFLTLNL